MARQQPNQHTDSAGTYRTMASRDDGGSRRVDPPRTMHDFPPRPSGASRSAQQRRRAARVRVGLPLKVRRHRDAKPSTDRCYDLAPNGMFIETSQALEPGNVLRFECDYGDQRAFGGLARVMWRRSRDDAHGPPGVGVSFVGLDPRGEVAIRAILAEHGEVAIRPERDATSVLPMPPSNAGLRSRAAESPTATDHTSGGEQLGKTLLGRPGNSQSTATLTEEGAEKRRSPRAPLSLDMRYSSVALRVERQGVCENISAHGVFLASEEPLAVGTAVRVHCEVGCAEHAIEGTGRVLWRRTRATGDGRPAGMAIAFTEVSATSQGVIDEVLRAAARPSSMPPANAYADTMTDVDAYDVEPEESAAVVAVVQPIVALAGAPMQPNRMISVQGTSRPEPAPEATGRQAVEPAPAEPQRQALAPEPAAEPAPPRPAPALTPEEPAAPQASSQLPPPASSWAPPGSLAPGGIPNDPYLREQRLRELIHAHAVAEEQSAPELGRRSRPSRTSQAARESEPARLSMMGRLRSLGPAGRAALGLAVLGLAWLLGRSIASLF